MFQEKISKKIYAECLIASFAVCWYNKRNANDYDACRAAF